MKSIYRIDIVSTRKFNIAATLEQVQILKFRIQIYGTKCARKLAGKRNFRLKKFKRQKLNTFESPYNVIEVTRKALRCVQLYVIWKTSLNVFLFTEPVFNAI
jgi:hypothetical protein